MASMWRSTSIRLISSEMSGQIVFLSLFLGLVSGKGLIDLHVDDAIKSVRVVVDGREVTTLTQPPWHA